MTKSFFSRLRRGPSWREIAQRQIDDANRMHLDHQAASEHHLALARMYQARVQRLEAKLANQEAA